MRPDLCIVILIYAAKCLAKMMSNLLKSKLNSNQKNNNGLSIKQYSVMKKLDRFLILAKFQHYPRLAPALIFPCPVIWMLFRNGDGL